jgi:hypothetical protein
MFKRLLAILGSKRFAITLLKMGAVYLAYLFALWVLTLMPPAYYMIWGPFAVWTFFFFVNLCISLVRDTYIYKGNYIFHFALLIILIGVVISSSYRFDGRAVVLEGDSFFGEEDEYFYHNAGGNFKSLAPDISFRLDEVIPTFWDDRLYFVGLEGKVTYPATTLDHKSSVYLNDGPILDFDGSGGARLRIVEYGIVPNIRLEMKARPLIVDGPLLVNVFPPGVEAVYEMSSYEFYLSVATDPYFNEDGKLKNRSLNLTNPVLKLRIKWMGQTLFDGLLKEGEMIRFANMKLHFKEATQYITVGVVRDQGEWIVFIGFILCAFGLIMRIVERIRGVGLEGAERKIMFTKGWRGY